MEIFCDLFVSDDSRLSNVFDLKMVLPSKLLPVASTIFFCCLNKSHHVATRWLCSLSVYKPTMDILANQQFLDHLSHAQKCLFNESASSSFPTTTARNFSRRGAQGRVVYADASQTHARLFPCQVFSQLSILPPLALNCA